MRTLFPSKSILAAMLSIGAATFAHSPVTFGQEASTDEAPALDVGSKAPPLDIEFYVQDGGGKYKPVTKFAKGEVYVVEFWATWCGPCIQSMPHLADLQTAHADDVRLISITDETLDEVKDLMGQMYPGTEKTFDEVTSAYTLTADPDGSTHKDYMGAAEIGGIPSAFLVGKTGLIEWIGHPAMIDEPLDEVLAGTWDMEAEKQRRERERRIQSITSKMSMLARAGKYDEALELVEKQVDIASGASEDEQDYWLSVVNSLKMSAGKLDDAAIAYYREKITEMEGDFMSLTRFSFSLFDVADSGGNVGPLASDADAAMAKLDGKVEKPQQGLYHYARALLNRIDENFDEAIAQQTKAVEVASGQQKERFQEALDELTAQRDELKEPADAKK